MFGLFPDLERQHRALGWTLSGGQPQMLAIARGLLARPQVLRMDEPSLGLAPVLVQQVLGVIKEINTRPGTTVLEGSAEDLLKDPQVRDAYLGGRGR